MINRQRCYKNFDKLKFKTDLFRVNWDGFRLTSNPTVNKLLDKHAPYYKTIKYSKTWYETEPWITPGLANSIRNKQIVQKLLQRKRSKNRI